MRSTTCFAAARLALALLVTIATASCRTGNDPADGEPRGVIVASRGNSIVTMTMAGAVTREYPNVPPIGQYGQHPAWIDAERVLVHTATPTGARIHVLDLATGILKRLTPDTTRLVAEWYPRHSAGWVYFMGETSGGRYEIWRGRPDGSQVAKAQSPSSLYADYYRPVVSPNGANLVVSTIENSTIGVRTFSATTGAVLSPWVAGGTSPRWSPDSRRVAFGSPGGGAIRVMNADGSGLRTISAGPYDEWFDWTRDGGWIVATNGTGLVLVNVATGTERPLADTRNAWQPSVR